MKKPHDTPCACWPTLAAPTFVIRQDQPDGSLHDTRVLPCAQFPTVAALAAYLAEVNIATPREAAFGIANLVTGDAIRMTNHS